MARYIDADELLRRLKELRDDLIEEGRTFSASGIGAAIVELKAMPTADAIPNDYHDRCMELEINRRFAAEEKVSEYPRVLDAIHGELANALGLVERLRKANDKSDE